MIPLRRVPLVIELARAGQLRTGRTLGCGRDDDPSAPERKPAPDSRGPAVTEPPSCHVRGRHAA